MNTAAEKIRPARLLLRLALVVVIVGAATIATAWLVYARVPAPLDESEILARVAALGDSERGAGVGPVRELVAILRDARESLADASNPGTYCFIDSPIPDSMVAISLDMQNRQRKVAELLRKTPIYYPSDPKRLSAVSRDAPGALLMANIYRRIADLAVRGRSWSNAVDYIEGALLLRATMTRGYRLRQLVGDGQERMKLTRLARDVSVSANSPELSQRLLQALTLSAERRAGVEEVLGNEILALAKLLENPAKPSGSWLMGPWEARMFRRQIVIELGWVLAFRDRVTAPPEQRTAAEERLGRITELLPTSTAPGAGDHWLLSLTRSLERLEAISAMIEKLRSEI